MHSHGYPPLRTKRKLQIKTGQRDDPKDPGLAFLYDELDPFV